MCSAKIIWFFENKFLIWNKTKFKFNKIDFFEQYFATQKRTFVLCDLWIKNVFFDRLICWNKLSKLQNILHLSCLKTSNYLEKMAVMIWWKIFQGVINSAKIEQLRIVFSTKNAFSISFNFDFIVLCSNWHFFCFVFFVSQNCCILNAIFF
jgi:hypothetical protein